ncbi:hypothetical protein BH23CHL5_BH23CHL5_21050 [soil metagenome]
MSAQSMVWFVIGFVAFFSGLRILHQRFVAKTPHAIQSRGSYTLFAFFMLIFAFFAVFAGFVSL